MGFKYRDRFSGRNAYTSKIFERSRKATCTFCGASLDVFHDMEKCSADYQNKCDAEARKAKEGRS